MLLEAPLDFPCPLCGARIAEGCKSERDEAVLFIHVERIYLTPTS